MTIFTSPIALGEKYIDPRSGIEGHANIVVFNENGCVEVQLEYTDKPLTGGIEIKTLLFNALRLRVANDTPEGGDLGDPIDYECDIVLGHQYRDIQTGIKGHASMVEFHERMATRAILRSVGADKIGVEVLRYHSIDDFLLEDMETKKVATPRTDRPSPVTREVTR